MGPTFMSNSLGFSPRPPVFSSSVPCPLCEQNMDLFGDHSLCCKKSGDRITRHNNVRNLVFKLADTGLLAGVRELGILTSPVVDPDSIKHWSLHRGFGIDVAVIHPRRLSSQ